MEQYKYPRQSRIITGYGDDYAEQRLDEFLSKLHNKAVDIQTSIATTPMPYNNLIQIHYSILVTWQQINPKENE
jgi:hypothetical protein